mmetsp:Transcript_39251/g.111120  ORF Transcript_39251/g.111120 Transcript_39251/m.111120 type:complete len:231 (+) Transcript_39251:349-1041(+)
MSSWLGARTFSMYGSASLLSITSDGMMACRMRADRHPMAYPVEIVSSAPEHRPARPPLVMESHGSRFAVQSGTMVTPRPKAMEMATIKRMRRVIGTEVMTLIPDIAMLANSTVVMPPRIGGGMLVKNAPTLPKIPKNRSHMAHPNPASLDATLVSDTTPLFWEKVVFGIVKATAAKKEFTESPRSPPCTARACSIEPGSRPEASPVAVRSPMVSTPDTTKPISTGSKAGA